jgi:hypothetical protein
MEWFCLLRTPFGRVIIDNARELVALGNKTTRHRAQVHRAGVRKHKITSYHLIQKKARDG